MISGNYTTYNNPQAISYGAVKNVVPQDVAQKLPENIQNLEAKDIANNNGAISTAQNADAKSMLLTLPIYSSFVALRSINDKIGSKFSFAGEYKDSLLGKLAKTGDNITGAVSKVVPDNVENAIPKKVNQFKNFMQKHFSFARSLSTPLKLESSMALQEANGLFGRVMFDDTTLFEKGFKGGADGIRKIFKKDGSTFWELLKKQGIEAADNDGAIKIISDSFKEIANKPVKSPEVQQYAKEIVESLASSDETFTIAKWGKLNVGKIPVLGKHLTLNVPASEVANKIRVSAGLSGSQLSEAATAGAAIGTTALGRALPSGFAKVYEGLTSNFVGGKLAPVLQAYFLASAAMRAKDAPKGQRLATFMDEEVGGIATLFTLPLATQILTKTGGMLKYLGMGKTTAEQIQNVDKYRNLIKNLNARVDAGTITRGEYVNEVKNIKGVLKGSTKWFQKPAKFLGSILGANYKAETIKPLTEAASSSAGKLEKFGVSMANKVQNIAYGLKTGKFAGITPGGALRFALVMFVLSPIVSKPIRWVVNKIFGKPYDPIKAKEEEMKKQQEEAMKNNPFANMSDEEMINLIQKNQDTIQAIQNNPEVMQEIQTNPQKLYEILQNGANEYDKAKANAPMSPILKQQISNKSSGQTNPMAQPAAQAPQSEIAPSNNIYSSNPIPQMNQTYNLNMNTNAKMPKPQVQKTGEINNAQNDKQKTTIEPKRTYIPSSKPAQQVLNVTSQEDARFNALMSDIDRTAEEYSKYLGI